MINKMLMTVIKPVVYLNAKIQKLFHKSNFYKKFPIFVSLISLIYILNHENNFSIHIIFNYTVVISYL